MGRLIKKFANGAFLEYDLGEFDEWCIYYKAPGQKRTPPRDEEYFAEMIALAQKYGKEKLYSDYLKVYQNTGKTLDNKVLLAISRLAQREYGQDAFRVDLLLTILYAGMIAEENKKNTKLGKRIKRLGVHGILMEEQDAKYAANFMKGMKSEQIRAMCEARGF